MRIIASNNHPEEPDNIRLFALLNSIFLHLIMSASKR